jgi:UDP-N-acetylglucosamine 2-epimerase
MTKRRIAVLTTGRQDWGILRSTCRALRRHDALELVLIAGGMHLSAFFGRTIAMLEEEGMRPDAALRWIDDDGKPGPLEQTAASVAQVGEVLARLAPDALIVVGDRFESP